MRDREKFAVWPTMAVPGIEENLVRRGRRLVSSNAVPL